MNAREMRNLQAFRNQVGHVRLHRLGARSRQVETMCSQLETCIAKLEQLASDVSLAQKTALKGTQVKLWRRRLRNGSLRPLAYAAKADLKLQLHVPHAEDKNALYIEAGEEFERVLRPHLDALVANGQDEDCLDILKHSTEQLTLYTREQSNAAINLKRLNREEDAELAGARAIAKKLHGAMLALSEHDPRLLGAWIKRKRIPKRPGGHKRKRGGHLEHDKRRAKPDRSPTGRPTEFNQSPEIPGS